MRFNALGAILRFVKDNNMLDVLKPYLESLPTWFEQWNTKPADQRGLYTKVANISLTAMENIDDGDQRKKNEK